jgi:hypothetical protein
MNSSDGRAVWIQRVKIPGVRRPRWTVVTANPQYPTAPEIVDLAEQGPSVRHSC